MKVKLREVSHPYKELINMCLSNDASDGKKEGEAREGSSSSVSDENKRGSSNDGKNAENDIGGNNKEQLNLKDDKDSNEPRKKANCQQIRKKRRNKLDRISCILHNGEVSDGSEQKPQQKYKLVQLEDDAAIKNGILGLAALGLIFMVYMAACRGWRGRISVAGIDLGTTNSVVCVQALSSGVGAIECIEDPYSGSNLVPSVVSFDQHSKKNKMKVFVGKQALERMNGHAHSTIYHAKRFLGRGANDEEVKDLSKEYEFSVVEFNEELHEDIAPPVIDYEFADGGGVLFHIPDNNMNGNAQWLSPEQIGSYVIQHLMDMTKEFLGYDNVKSAVIAVPAKFTMVQRQATAMAFKMAGIKVARVLEEPVAAALAYGLHRKSDVDHILVYDFGGGTLDVSVLHVSEGFVDVMASEGDDTLGGADFDSAIAHYLMKKEEYAEHLDIIQKALYKVKQDSSLDIDSDVLLEEIFAQKCSKIETVPLCHGNSFHTIGENIKIQLSDSDQGYSECLGLNKSFWEKSKSRLLSPEELCDSLELIIVSMTAAEFNQAAQELFERSRIPIKNVLASLDLIPDDVDEVVMVGGTSRMPAIRELVKEELQVLNLNTHIDPDVTVAFGCASVID